MSQSAKANVRLSLALDEYRASHGLHFRPQWAQSVWSAVAQSLQSTLPMLLPILVIVLASDIVSGEYASGTIKMLLIHPQSRSKILLSKLLTVIWASGGILLVAVFTMATFDLIAYGAGGATEPIAVNVYYERVQDIMGGNMIYNQVPNIDHLRIIPIWLFTLVGIVLGWLSCIVIAALTFLLSVMFRSVSATMGIAIGVLVAGTIATGVASGGGLASWMVPLFFSHLNLLGAWTGDLSRAVPTTLGLSIFVLLLWIIAAAILAWRVFTRRDVLA